MKSFPNIICNKLIAHPHRATADVGVLVIVVMMRDIQDVVIIIITPLLITKIVQTTKMIEIVTTPHPHSAVEITPHRVEIAAGLLLVMIHHHVIEE